MSGHECTIARLPVEHPMAPCSDLSYATTRSPLILVLFQESTLGEPRPVDSLFRSSPSSAF
ncbi:hypothetical protein RND71_014170 [Anisodus tanguticus]|uniref:Uncharacterized protein n=1 Tax=Anisodus tanguticus TaxID=243964 RepID=A0AAE1SAQ5_9SOLA|nr:hypothetical protein RND71_014170 [Anisodus tanguticus]